MLKYKLKKNWKIILIVLLLLFSLNKCTVSCNRQGVIDKQNLELSNQDSIIKIQNDSIKILNIELTNKLDKEEAVSDAHNLGNDYYNYTINKLNDSIKILNKNLKIKNEKIKSLNNNVIKLETQIKVLTSNK